MGTRMATDKKGAASWEERVTRTNGTASSTAQEPYLIFFASTTPEKQRDLQMIADHKGLPIQFIDIRDLLGAFHSVDEKGGSYKANALDKLREIEHHIERYKADPAAIAAYCEQHHIPFDPARIYFATEDTGFSFEKPTWSAIRPALDQVVPAEVLARIDQQQERDHNWGGPGVETGPVISATLGPKNLMELAHNAIEKISAKQVSIFERSTLTLRRLESELTEPSIVIPGEVRHYMYKPKDASKIPGKVSTHHYWRTRDVVDKSAAEEGETFILQHSPRVSVIDAFAKRHKMENPGHATPLKPIVPETFKVGFMPDQTPLAEHVKIVTMLETMSGTLGKKRFALAVPDNKYFSDAPDENGPSRSGSYQFTPRGMLSVIEGLVRESDAMLLMPDMRENGEKIKYADPELAKFEKLYTLTSLVVAKQLIHRDANKPIIILNHDGSWDDAIKVHNSLVNTNMTKAYNIAVEKSVNDARIESNGTFDVIHGKTYNDTLRTALKLLTQERAHYERRPHLPEEEFEGGIKPHDHDSFKVAVFCSASSENKILNESVNEVGYQLAKHDFGIIYGGGDRYTMGAVLDGVKRYRHELTQSETISEEQAQQRVWIGGYSTSPILVSETKRGHFPEGLSYYRQTENIYHRMADMLENSDAVVVAPGGDGTLQEWVAMLMLKKQDPERFQHKGIVVYNPVLFRDKGLSDKEQKIWDTTLKVVLGDDYELLSKDPSKMEKSLRRQYNDRCRELGIYIETSPEAVETRLEGLCGRSGHGEKVDTNERLGGKLRDRRNAPASPSERTIAG